MNKKTLLILFIFNFSLISASNRPQPNNDTFIKQLIINLTPEQKFKYQELFNKITLNDLQREEYITMVSEVALQSAALKPSTK